MRTQKFGWSLVCGDGFTHPDDDRSNWRFAVKEAIRDYKNNRSSGNDRDSPSRPLPEDGEKSNWIKCPDEHTLPTPRKKGFFSKGGYIEGYNGSGFYRIRYEEGPGDRAWMEERDRNYMARMEKAKAHAEKIASVTEQAAKLSHGGQYLEAVKLCDFGISEDTNNIGLRKQRASYHEALFQQSKSPRLRKLYLAKALEDYQHCVSIDEYDEPAATKVEQLNALLAGSTSGGGAAAAAPSPSLSPAIPAAPPGASSGLRSAIKACDEAVTRNSNDIEAHKA